MDIKEGFWLQILELYPWNCWYKVGSVGLVFVSLSLSEVQKLVSVYILSLYGINSKLFLVILTIAYSVLLAIFLILHTAHEFSSNVIIFISSYLSDTLFLYLILLANS